MEATTLDFTPLLDWSLLAGLGLLAALVVGVAFLRRARGAWWRLLAAALLLLSLANPTLIEEQRRPLKDIVFLVLDESASQDIGERRARSAVAFAHLEEALAALPDVEVRTLRLTGAGLDDKGTQLFEPLEEALANVPRQQVAGIFLVSDGQIHDVPESLTALGVTAPLHLLLSDNENQNDRRLTIVKAPSFGIVGKPQELVVRIDDLPGGSGSAAVTLTVSGAASVPLTLPIGVDVPVPFTLERRGETVIEVAVEAGPAELSLLNNRAAIAVNGVRDRLRVLLVSGDPYAGERVWRNTLKSDPAVDLIHFTILRPPEKQDGTPIEELALIAFPTRELFEERLDDFDLIIFDRYRQRVVLQPVYLENVARYVERGGALLEAAGPSAATQASLYLTPLGRIMPSEPTGQIIEEGFRPTVTAVGRRHPVTSDLEKAEAPWGRWFRLIDAYPPVGGEVVMSGPDDRPLLVLSHVGEGRVAQLFSDQIWLWTRGYEGGGPQAELLRRIAHWLMKEPDLEEEDLRATVASGLLIVERRSLLDEVPPIEITSPSGAVTEITLQSDKPGYAQASTAIVEAGVYRITDGTHSILVAAGELNAREFHDLRASREALSPLIESSLGGVINLVETPHPAVRKVAAERQAAGRNWLGVATRNAYVVTGVTQAPLLPGWAYLLLALSSAFLAWRREGR